MTDMLKKLIGSGCAAAALSIGTLAGPVAAQPQQEGLVNVNVTDVTIQVPIAVAANVCNVKVAVLADLISTGDAQCDADAASDATFVGGNGNGGASQRGLVNLNLDDVVVQIPIGLAANVCDVDVAVLVEQLDTGSATCDAVANAG
jgi:hypothetical protein